MIREKAIIGFNSFAKDALICFSGAFLLIISRILLKSVPFLWGGSS